MFRKSILSARLACRILLPASILIAQIAPAAAAGDAASQAASDGSSTVSEAGQKANLAIAQLQTCDINDIAYALQRVRQQAINIYVEAIRKIDSPAVTVELPTLTRVPAVVPKDMTGLLPFRRPWLVYFITSLEPLVHLLKQDINDIATGARKLRVEPETRQAIDPLIKEGARVADRISDKLAALAALVEDADKSNIELARIAYELDSEVSTLEKIRDKCFTLVDDMEQKWKKYGSANSSRGGKQVGKQDGKQSPARK
jgi:hypothetical protein